MCYSIQERIMTDIIRVMATKFLRSSSRRLPRAAAAFSAAAGSSYVAVLQMNTPGVIIHARAQLL